MNRRKHWKIAAVILVVAGLLVCAVSLASLDFDFRKLSLTEYVTNTYEVKESFRNITMDVHRGEIEFVLSDDGECRVVCHEEADNLHQVRVEGDTLIIEVDKRIKWYVDFGSFVEKPSVTVYLPENSYGALAIDGDTVDVTVPADFSFDSIRVKLDTGDFTCRASAAGSLTVRTSTGSIKLYDLSAGDISLDTSTGSNSLENITCSSLTSSGSTGSITLTNVIVSGKLSIERNTGSVRFDGCDADSIYVETDTGSVKGTLLTEKIFAADSDTGSVDVPRSGNGGLCEITTDTGSIRIEIQNP